MIEAAYYYGLKPSEVTELSAAEVASFIQQQEKRRLDDHKMLAHLSYSAGILGSMALAKRMPKFEEVFKFPDEPVKEVSLEDAKRSQVQLRALAANLNAQVQNEGKEER